MKTRRRTILISFFLPLCCTGCRELILHDLDELRANQVIVVLAEAGIPAEKARDGARWNIAVDRSRTVAALQAIEQSRILRRDLERVRNDSESLLRSKEERVHAIDREISWNLERTLEQLPGVLEARVHLSRRADRSIFSVGEQTEDSASVLLLAVADAEPNEEEVRKLVSGGSGIDPKQVSLFIARAPRRREGNGVEFEARPHGSTAASAVGGGVAPHPWSERFFGGGSIPTVALVAGALSLVLISCSRGRSGRKSGRGEREEERSPESEPRFASAARPVEPHPSAAASWEAF